VLQLALGAKKNPYEVLANERLQSVCSRMQLVNDLITSFPICFFPLSAVVWWENGTL